MRADLMIPYGCRNGACGTCKGRILEGSVDFGAHQPSTLTDDEKRRGIALFCVARPRSDLVIEVREVRRAGRHPDQAAAVPDRIDRQARARRRDRQAQAAVERAAAIPGRPVHRFPAEGRAPAQLLDRHAAARRRAARAAHPAHARRVVHRSAVHDVQGPRNPALRRSARHVLPARGQRQAGDLRRRRNRVSRRSRR